MAWSDAARAAAAAARQHHGSKNAGKLLHSTGKRVGASRQEIANTLREVKTFTSKRGGYGHNQNRTQINTGIKRVARAMLQTFGAAAARKK